MPALPTPALLPMAAQFLGQAMAPGLFVPELGTAQATGLVLTALLRAFTKLIKPRLQSLYQCLPPAGPTLIPPGPGQLLILILD